jgi:hypothetical protein
MRLISFFAATACCVAAFAAPTASASPPWSGCPATGSVIAEVSYVVSPSADWEGTSLYTFLFVDTTTGQATMEHFGFASEEEAYFDVVSFLEAEVDLLNDDQTVCMNWIGRNRGQDDYIFNAVDNVANTRR